MIHLGRLPIPNRCISNRDCMSVVSNNHPIDWCGSAVYIIILIAFGSDQREMFRDLIDALTEKLYENRGNIVRMQNIDSYEDFMKWLRSSMEDEHF